MAKHLKKSGDSACFDPKYYLRHLDKIFRRVFGSAGRVNQQRERKIDDSSTCWCLCVLLCWCASLWAIGVGVEAADREKLLSEPGVYGTFAAFSLRCGLGEAGSGGRALRN